MKNYYISYDRDNVPQAIIIKAESLDAAVNFFTKCKPDAIIYGVNEKPDITAEIKKGMPIVTAK